MAQITDSLYRIIAKRYDYGITALQDADDQILEALNEVVDITTTNTDGAVDIELALLTPANQGYTFMVGLVTSNSGLLNLVRAINNYVINNSTGTPTVDFLSDFVTALDWSVVDGTWDTAKDGSSATNCVPYYWCQLSEDAGYAIGSWPCCSIT